MHRRHVLTPIGIAVLTITMAGCSHVSRAPGALTPLPGTSTILQESAARAANAQEQLVRIQTARTAPAPAPLNETMAGVPEELRRPTTIEWSGPGEEPARRIATIVGYEFRVTGNPPATPPMVNVSMQGVPAIKALEDLGNQVQPFAQIVVDASLGRIEYRHLPMAGAGIPASRPTMSK